jgi:hypothetical protein
MARRISTTEERKRIQFLRKAGSDKLKAERVQRHSEELHKLFLLGVPEEVAMRAELMIYNGEPNYRNRVHDLINRVKMLKLGGLPLRDAMSKTHLSAEKEAKRGLVALGFSEAEIRPLMLRMYVRNINIADVPKTDAERRAWVNKTLEDRAREKGALEGKTKRSLTPTEVVRRSKDGVMLENQKFEAAKFFLGEALSKGHGFNIQALERKVGRLNPNSIQQLKSLVFTARGTRELIEMFRRERNAFEDLSGIASDEEKFRAFMEHQKRRKHP